MTRTCALCGTAADCPEGGLPPGWSIATGERNRVEHLCVDCARRHLRAIEAKLPEEYW